MGFLSLGPVAPGTGRVCLALGTVMEMTCPLPVAFELSKCSHTVGMSGCLKAIKLNEKCKPLKAFPVLYILSKVP